jgi:hypothetical protein
VVTRVDDARPDRSALVLGKRSELECRVLLAVGQALDRLGSVVVNDEPGSAPDVSAQSPGRGRCEGSTRARSPRISVPFAMGRVHPTRRTSYTHL